MTSRLSESIQTSMGHSIVACGSSLGVFAMMARGEGGALSGGIVERGQTDRRDFYRA